MITPSIVAPSNNLKQARFQHLVVTLFLLGLSFVLWLPLGFNVACWLDGWPNMAAAANGTVVVLGASRPFTNVAPWLGYILDHNSFTGLNLVLFLLLFLTGILLYLILHQFNIPRVVTAAAGALVIVYPADSLVFYLGAVNIRFALVCYMLAVYLLLIYTYTRRRYLIPLFWLALLFSVGTYEAGYPLIAVTPVLLFLLPRNERTLHIEISGKNETHTFTPRRSIRSLITISILWYYVPVFYIVHLFVLSLQSSTPFSYQSGAVANTASITEIFQSFLNVYKSVLYSGWITNYGLISNLDIFLSIGVGIVAFGVFLWLAFHNSNPGVWKRTFSSMLALGLVGIATLGLGFMVYLPTVFRDETGRTLYYSSVGGAVCLVVGIWLLSTIASFKRLMFSLLIGIIVGLGTLRLLDQHNLAAMSQNKVNVVWLTVSKQLPEVKPGSAILLIDESPSKYLQSVFPVSYYLGMGIQLAMGDSSLQGSVCYPNQPTVWSGLDQRCVFQDDKVVLSVNQRLTLQSDYGHLIVLRYTGDGKIELQSDLHDYTQNPEALSAYQPEKLINVSGRVSPRATTLFPVFTNLPN